MTEKFERRYIDSKDCSYRAYEEDGNKYIEGYASRYGVRSKLILEKGELFYEEINRGAFKNILEKEGLDVVYTFNHNRNVVLARTVSNTLELSEDDKGLFFRAHIEPLDSDANNLWLRIQRGDIFENSFAFKVKADDYRWGKTDDGKPLRMIDNISALRDTSSVVYAAYPETNVSVRELSKINEETEERTQDDITEMSETDKKDIETKIKIIKIKNKI